MRVVFLGSGSFGLPTVKALAGTHEVALVVSRPDQPAGRSRKMRPTPIASWALEEGRALTRPEDVNAAEAIDEIRSLNPDALVVIAFGQKVSEALLEDLPAFNLHASLLPAYRGAAPINRAVMDGCTSTGVSVIGLAQRMDAGPIYAQASTAVDPGETAGELHDRLAELGPQLMLETLAALESGTLEPQEQEDSLATKASKLSRAEATVDFNQPASAVRARIHGLTPWPGCDILLNGERLRILRVSDFEDTMSSVPPGTLLDDGSIACSEGRVLFLQVQPAGGRAMSFDAYRNGRSLEQGAHAEEIS